MTKSPAGGHPRRARDGFEWADGLEAFDRQPARPRDRPRILHPEDPGRATRWAEVLRRYVRSTRGIPQAECDVPRAVSRPPACAEDVVISLGDRFHRLASWFAQWQGRRFVQVSSLEAIDPAGWRSLLLVGEPRRFLLDQLNPLAGRLHVPWGIVTARDEAGLTFALAKIHIGTRVAWPASALISAIDETLQERRGGGHIQHAWDAGRLGSWLKEGPWDALNLLAHGETGCIKCGPFVLCGGPPGGERESSGLPPSDENQGLSSFADIPARVLLLHSCSGFSLGGELCSSDHSSVLSVAEGFPAMLVSTSMQVFLVESDVRAAAALHDAGVAPGQIVRLLNDFYEAREGVRPYVLFGDPAGPAPRRSPWPLQGSKCPSPRASVLLLRAPNGSREWVLSARSEGRSLELLHGGESVAVLAEPGGFPGAVEIEDRTDRWVALVSAARAAAERCQHAAVVERAIARTCERFLAESEEARRIAAAMTEIRRQAEFLAQAALSALQKGRLRQSWDPRAEELLEGIADDLSLWDRLAGALFCESLRHVELWTLVTDGAESVSVVRLAPPSPCPLAPDRHLVRESVTRPLWLDGRCVIHRECTVCGPTELWVEGGVRLRPWLAGEVFPGARVRLGVEIDETESVSPNGADAIVALVLAEKRTSRLLFRSLAPASPTSTFEVTLPEDLVLEVHTLYAVHLRHGHWAYGALRVPAFCR